MRSVYFSVRNLTLLLESYLIAVQSRLGKFELAQKSIKPVLAAFEQLLASCENTCIARRARVVILAQNIADYYSNSFVSSSWLISRPRPPLLRPRQR